MVDQRLVDGGNGEEGVDPPGLEQLDDRVGLEAGQEQDPAALEQGRKRVEVDSGGVEMGEEAQGRVGRSEADGGADIDQVRERHPVGVDHPFRPSGRPRRIEQIPDPVGRPQAAPGTGRRGLDQALIVAVEVERGRRRGEAADDCPVLAAVEEQPGSAMGEQGIELGRGHPPVERDEDRSEPGAGEQGFEEGEAVAAEDRDPIPLPDSPGLEQGRHPGGALGERRVGQAPAGRKLLERDGVGGQLRTARKQVGQVGGHHLFLSPSDTSSMAMSATSAGLRSSCHRP
jgi:hypothetical protein